MNNIIKLGIGAAAIGLLYVASKAKQAISQFGLEITGYGRPTLSGTTLKVPLYVTFNNTTKVPLNIDSLVADIYLDKNGKWVKAAHIEQPVSIPPGTSTQTISPNVDLKSIIGGSALDTINAINQIANSRTLNIKADVSGQYGAVSIPTRTITKTITF